MVRLIQKTGYIKAGKAAGYMRYIATREGVVLLPAADPLRAQPATAPQKKLIAELLRDFPDSRRLFEYADYKEEATLGAASSFISAAIDFNVHKMQDSDKYLNYIAYRPQVEKLGLHGLFSAADQVDIEKLDAELQAHTGPVWTLIYSLERPDASRLGYDNAATWRQLVCAKQTQIAQVMGIPLSQLAWCAAYHDADTHPHIHLMVWSREPKLGYLSHDGVVKLRSSMTNTIFQDEMHSVYKQKDIAYKELTAAARQSMSELIAAMENGVCDDPQLEVMMGQLAERLKTYHGKMQYGYLPKGVKRLVNDIVERLSAQPDVAACYEVWNKLRDEIESYYKDTPRIRLPLSEQKEFHAVKNIVVREAARLADPEAATPKEQEQASGSDNAAGAENNDYRVPVPPGRDPALFFAVTRMLRHMGRIFRENAVPPANPAGPRIDSKRRRKIMEKRLAMGQRLDDTMQSLE